MGRDMTCDCWSCDLICAASSTDLYRINLEQGRFLSSLNTQSTALNVVSRSKVHELVAGGGEDGAVELHENEVFGLFLEIHVKTPKEVTSIEFDGDGGYLMAVGSSNGKGEGVTSIEPTAGKNNDTCVFSQSGFIVLALASSQIPSYFHTSPWTCTKAVFLFRELNRRARGGWTYNYL